jgi:hypothetical protein
LICHWRVFVAFLEKRHYISILIILVGTTGLLYELEGIPETYDSKDTYYASGSRNLMLLVSSPFFNVPLVALGNCHYLLVPRVLPDCF